MIGHTKECLREQDKAGQLRGTWTAKWPNYCMECNGYGSICEYYDPSPPGVALGQGYMTDCYPCEVCVGNGNCPRCGEHTFQDSDEGPCSECGFNYDDSLPPMMECICSFELVEYLD